MSEHKPRKNEHLVADVERWQLEMAQELGIIQEIRSGQVSDWPRPVIRSYHPRVKDNRDQRSR